MNMPQLPKLKLNMVNFLNVVGIVAIVSLVITLGQTVKRNYDLNKELSGLQGQITLLQNQRDELAYNIQYYKTDSFQEREARAKLGMQLPGEQVVVLPKPTATPAPAPDPSKTVKKKSHFQQWLDFLGGNS